MVASLLVQVLVWLLFGTMPLLEPINGGLWKIYWQNIWIKCFVNIMCSISAVLFSIHCVNWSFIFDPKGLDQGRRLWGTCDWGHSLWRGLPRLYNWRRAIRPLRHHQRDALHALVSHALSLSLGSLLLRSNKIIFIFCRTDILTGIRVWIIALVALYWMWLLIHALTSTAV